MRLRAFGTYTLKAVDPKQLIQELVGRRRGRWYYPLIAGTAQSYNYYPISYLKPAAMHQGPPARPLYSFR